MICWYKIRFNKNRKNVWKDGGLNPTLLGERQLCLPHNHEITKGKEQNLRMSFLLENFGISPHFQGFSEGKKGDTLPSSTGGTVSI